MSYDLLTALLLYKIKKTMWSSIGNVVNYVPLVGNVKAGIHYVAGDTEGAKKAYESEEIVILAA